VTAAATPITTFLARSSVQRWHVEQGNSLDVLRQLPDASVDAIIGDNPYCSGGQSAAARSQSPTKKYVQSGTKKLHPDFPGDTRDQRSFAFWGTLWLAECLRVSKPGAPICLFSDWRQLPITTDMLQAGGWTWRGILPWDKTESVRPCRGRFSNQAEYVIWGSNGPMPLERNVGCLPGAFREAVKAKEKLHLTGKPIELMRQLVRVCAPGGLIVDPFAGSSSTGVACLHEGYRYLGIEMTPVYTHISKKRLVDTERLLAAGPAALAAAAPSPRRSRSRLARAEAACA
jgi:site-specific DNA-methyltransferase (adenine-specific)